MYKIVLTDVLQAPKGTRFKPSDSNYNFLKRLVEITGKAEGGNKSFKLVGEDVVKCVKVGNFLPALSDGDVIVIPARFDNQSLRVMASNVRKSLTMIEKNEYCTTFRIGEFSEQ